MVSGYRSADIDFDDRFDFYVEGPKSIDTGRRVGGVDLSQRYAHISYDSRGPDTGFRVNGADVATLWAAKGTASYVSDGGLPSPIRSYQVTPDTAGISVEAGFTFYATGVVSWSRYGFAGEDDGAGRWIREGGGASGYDIRLMALSNSGGGLIGTGTGWLQLNVDRTVRFTSTIYNGHGNDVANYSARVQVDIRSRQGQNIALTKVIDLQAIAERAF